MSSQRYLFNRSDFRPLPVKLEHMDIHLDFRDGHVDGRGVLRMTARQSLDEITLDAQELDIHSVEWVDDSSRSPLEYDYRKDKNALIVRLPDTQAKGSAFSIGVSCTCVPSDTILDGIYHDVTPPGCPPQYVSQCQQWGFQRILPVLDDCTAKCTMVTTLEADARYTHLISNGNVSRTRNPDGKPILKPGDPSRKIVTYENLIPMAPYLFVVCVGTWDMLEDEVVYPSGRRVKLEYLTPPGRKAGAVWPMKILKESVLWQGRTQEYEYPREVYRTICMEKSNFGGMENVGNTTIITDAALIDEYTSDRRVEYSYGVTVHEFEHNQCGSDVTMETPFDMWLNEAFTVEVERQFCMSEFDPDVMRLDQVDAMRAPVGGPLAIEDGGHLGKIVREGFNNPDELVDGVTYVKAAEAIRMLKLILGADEFRKAKNLYFSRYTGSNANTDQFFQCFEEVSGRDLSLFKQEWLYTIGYPTVEARWRYEAASRKLCIRCKQTRVGTGGLFHVPLSFGAVDRLGCDLPGTARVVEVTQAEQEYVLDGVDRPAFVSFNRDQSFYGAFVDASATTESLTHQVRMDPNGFNRVEAMRRLTDLERIQLIRDPGADVGKTWQDIYDSIVRDGSLRPGMKSCLLRIDEQSLDRQYLPFYRERYEARIRLLKAAAEGSLESLRSAYRSVDTYRHSDEPKDGVDERRLKAVLLRTLVEANTPEMHALAEDHFHRAWNITDRVSALSCINVSEHPNRRNLLEEGFLLWKDHLSAYSSYLAIVAGGVHDDVFEMIELEERRAPFSMRHPGHTRSLYVPMASNNRMLWTDRGIRWVAETVVKLASVNENTAIRLLACFQQAHRLGADLKPKVIAVLRQMHEQVKSARAPSVAGRVQAYLDGAR